MSEVKETENLTPTEPVVTEPVVEPAAPVGDPAAEPESLISGEPKADDPPVADAPEPLVADDITFPEGMEVPDEIREELLTVLNDTEASPKDRAQALVDLQAKVAGQASEAASQQFQDQQRQWQDEVKNDPEIGGEKFQSNLQGIQRLVDQFGNEEFAGVMAATGAGNNIHVVRFFHAIAQKVNEGGPISGAPANAEDSAASRMFPSMKG